MKLITSFISGLIFAFGLGISGMTQPQKIVQFLDLFGNWDPTLLFVMIGAIAVHSTAYLTLKSERKPLFAKKYTLPQRASITKQLILGSFIFGVGWGISGFCPGPALVSIPSGNLDNTVFVITMALGMIIYRFFFSKHLQ